MKLPGLEKLDDGLLQMTQGLRVCYVPQEPLFEAERTVFEIVSEGVAEAKALRERYEAHAPGEDLDALQTRIEALDAWTWEQQALVRAEFFLLVFSDPFPMIHKSSSLFNV